MAYGVHFASLLVLVAAVVLGALYLMFWPPVTALRDATHAAEGGAGLLKVLHSNLTSVSLSFTST